MLVLVRKPGESVQIGENVELRVLSISGKRVRIGLVCPRGVRIMRNELMERQFAAGLPRAGGRINPHRPDDRSSDPVGRAGGAEL